MFVQQGARQFEIWTGKPAPEEEMLRVVLHALKQAAESGQASVRTTAQQSVDLSAPIDSPPMKALKKAIRTGSTPARKALKSKPAPKPAKAK